MNSSTQKDRHLTIISFLLIVLWVYTAVVKYSDLALFRHELNLQHFPAFITALLAALLPAVELLAAILLIIPITLRAGLNLSFLLLSLFTVYVGLVWMGLLGNHPCSCGGVLKWLSWRAHLLFNLFFLILNGYGLYLLTLRERRVGHSR